MFAILTDISPSFATVGRLATCGDLAEAIEEMGDADEVIHITIRRPSVGDRIHVDRSEYIADPIALAC